MMSRSGFRLESAYTAIQGLNAYRGMWHAHVQGAFPGFIPARELCLRGGYSFLGVTEHDNRFTQMQWSEQDWYAAQSADFLVIRGFEATHPLGHITCLGFLPEQTGVDADAARRIRFEKAQLDAGYGDFLKTAAGLGAFLALNHPAKWRGRAHELTGQPDFDCLHALEIYNGNQVGKSLAQGYTPDLLDDCLTQGCRIWAAANPDCHSWDTSQADGPFNGYNVVYAHRLTRQAILESLKQGRFYASTGQEVDTITVTGDSLQITAPACRIIRFIGPRGRVLQEDHGEHATFRFTGEEGHVRAELEGHQPSPLSVGNEPARAWLQPVRVTPR